MTDTLNSRETPYKIMCVFADSQDAQLALNDIRSVGFLPEQISLISPNASQLAEGRIGDTPILIKDVGTGAITGGITGTLVAGLFGLGAFVIPGIGPVLAAGIFGTVLAGATVGAVAGGIWGALVDLGIPEEQARGYEENLRAGSMLLMIDANNQDKLQLVQDIMIHYGGKDVRTYPANQNISSTNLNMPQAVDYPTNNYDI